MLIFFNKLKFKWWCDESVDESPAGWAEWLRSSWPRWPPGCKWGGGSVVGSGCWVVGPLCTRWWWSSWQEKEHAGSLTAPVSFSPPRLAEKKKNPVVRGVLGGQRRKGKSWQNKKRNKKQKDFCPLGWFITEPKCSCCRTDISMVTTASARHTHSGKWVRGAWNLPSAATHAVFNERLISPPFVIAPIFSDFLFMVWN